jgi:hypothetical protein
LTVPGNLLEPWSIQFRLSRDCASPDGMAEPQSGCIL